MPRVTAMSGFCGASAAASGASALSAGRAALTISAAEINPGILSQAFGSLGFSYTIMRRLGSTAAHRVVATQAWERVHA